jgi:hypothetical protein
MNMNKSVIRLLLLLLLLFPVKVLLASVDIADTSYNFLFKLNMTKAIQDGLFNADSDNVYVDFEEAVPDLQLLQGSDRLYSGLVQQGLDSGLTYHYNFRINDSIDETIDREVIASPGITEIYAWWNDEYLNTTTFRIDFSGTPDSIFRTGIDTIQILGDMTEWEPMQLSQVGSTSEYDITFHLDPNLLYEYIYRIWRDTVFIYEDFGGLSRMFLPPDTTITVVQYFDNLDTTKILLTLECNMNIQTQLNKFDPQTDFLDVAGNFNDWGAWDLLYDPYQTGRYTIAKLFDNSLIGGPPVEFKFRINGSWATAELDSLDPRSYTLQPLDTNGNPNTYTCWYNNEGPIVPSPPWVTDLYIQGLLEVNQVLTGSYLYHSVSGIPEGNSLYKWYRADSVGATLEPIDSAWSINYVVDSVADLGKYLVFEVTPVASSGEDSIGQPEQVYTTGRIGAVGIHEFAQNPIRLYPNPALYEITCEGKYVIKQIEIYSLTGKLLFRSELFDKQRVMVPVSALPSGMYLLKAFSDDLLPSVQRFVKK